MNANETLIRTLRIMRDKAFSNMDLANEHGKAQYYARATAINEIIGMLTSEERLKENTEYYEQYAYLLGEEEENDEQI